MKRHLAHLCVRLGLLPHWHWFEGFLLATLYRPVHPRDEDGGPIAWIELPAVSPAAVARFGRWWTAIR